MVKLPDVVRTVEHFESQAPVVCYTAPAPTDLRGVALQAELIAAGLPEHIDVSASAANVRVAVLNDEENDYTATIAKTLKAHNGDVHPDERELPDIIAKGVRP